MGAHLEVERKFLVDSNYIIPVEYSSLIKQVHFFRGIFDVRFRKRIFADRPIDETMTIKIGFGVCRLEITIPIKSQFFTTMWKLGSRRIIKHRFIDEQNGHKVEFDVYQGKLKGLKICEIEFENRDEASQFQPVEYMIKDITKDKTYKNNALSRCN
jgi:CYTH domain-containing protein